MLSVVVGCVTCDPQSSGELERKTLTQRIASDTALTSHMYEGQKWLALSRRLIAEHMLSKFKRGEYAVVFLLLN